MRILWIPHASWATPQRAREFCRELAARHEVHVTDWVADFQSPLHLLSARYVRNFTYRRSRDGAITVHGIARIAPAFFSRSLRRFNSQLFAFQLRRIISAARIDVVVGSFVAPPPDAGRLIFDVSDDNVGYTRIYGRPSYADEVQAAEDDYMQRANAIVTASSVLRDRIPAGGNRGPVTWIPNGVRLDTFSPAAGEQTRNALGLTGPIVGLVGNHEKWIELERVLEVARLLSGTPATFLVVGRGKAATRAARVVHAARMTNVRFVGYVPPEQVGAYFSAIDVGLCPYSKNPAADAASPMRLVSYSAAGSTVVCTRLEEVTRMAFSNVILVGDSPSDIASGVREAIGRPRQRPAQIHEYDMRTLAKRYEQVLGGKAWVSREAVGRPGSGRIGPG